MKPERVEIAGIPVDRVTMSQALEVVDYMVQQRESGTVLAVNPEKVTTARKSPQLARSLRNARLLVPDGIGIVFAARLLGKGEMVRVAGADLMPGICALAADKGYRVFVFGGTPESNQKATEVLERRFPGLQIVGRHDGYVNEEDMDQLVNRINQSGAEILFIALGSPKQEMWMETYLPRLNVNVCQGIGGTLDTLSGAFGRAPVFYQRIHLEWLYQMVRQPKRFKRLPARIVFGWRVLREWGANVLGR